MNIRKYLENHTTYVINSSKGRFTYPMDMQLELIGLSHDVTIDIELSTGRISPKGIYTKYFTQTIYGILFIHSVRFSILETKNWINRELEELYKARRITIPTKERFIELERRESTHLSPEYLLGLLMIPSVQEIVFGSKPRNVHTNTTGELVATIYDAKGKERIYKVTDTGTMSSVYFEVNTKTPMKYLKQLGSIATHSTLTIEKDGTLVADFTDEKKRTSIMDYEISIQERYKQLKGDGGI